MDDIIVVDDFLNLEELTHMGSISSYKDDHCQIHNSVKNVDVFDFYIPFISKQLKHLDTTLSYEERVNHLMNEMTLDEKIAQMCQFVGLNYLASTSKNMTTEDILNSDSKASYPGLMTKDIADMIVDGKIGSFLHVLIPEHANQLQRLAAKSRLKIPLLIGIDAIHGNGMVRGTTIYPSNEKSHSGD